MNSNGFTTLDTFDTELSADSVEWCPIEPYTDIFACGTYQLSNNDVEGETEKTPSANRLGRIYLFRVRIGGKLKLLQQLEVPAVLDMKWLHETMNHKILLGVANSVGEVQIYELVDKEDILLEPLSQGTISGNDSEVLALSLDWSSRRCNKDNQDVKLVVSDSKGCITTFKFAEAQLQQERTWNAHGYEAWIAAFDYWNSNVVYTGGDDGKFQWFDLRNGTQPAGVNRSHGAGVTSLHSNATEEFILASGSYDEILRIWDVRSIRHPLSELNLGGGIWRLKWDPRSQSYLIAACMYGGFKVIDCVDKGMPNVVGHYAEHQSISYGCDWSFLSTDDIESRKFVGQSSNSEGSTALISTCSFYDHTLKLAATDFLKR